MKKIISSILIVIILCNVFLPKCVFASYEDTSKSTFGDITLDKDQYEQDSENGKSSVNGKEHGYEITTGEMNSVIKNLTKIVNILPSVAKIVMDVSVKDDNEPQENKKYGEGFSIQKLVFNKIEIFNINFFSSSDTDSDFSKNIKSNIANIYYAIRNVAIVAMLIVLIYTGIRMAISSVAEKKAKYKQMLMAWVVAFASLMLLPYIMIAILDICQVVLNIFEGIMEIICGDEIKLLEEDLLGSTTDVKKLSGWGLIIPSITYWIIVFYQVKFFWMYTKRIFSTSFLIVISPLVLVQHAFDKITTGAGGAFNKWLTEFALNIAIQPIHALTYMIFMAIGSNIVDTAPLLSVLLFMSMSRGERVVRNMLSIKNTTTVQGMDENFKAKDMIENM